MSDGFGRVNPVTPYFPLREVWEEPSHRHPSKGDQGEDRDGPEQELEDHEEAADQIVRRRIDVRI